MTSDLSSSLRLVEVFRSQRLADCDPQTLVLSAVGIHSWTLMRDGDYVIYVAEDTLEAAKKHLSEAAHESLQRFVPPPAPAARASARVDRLDALRFGSRPDRLCGRLRRSATASTGWITARCAERFRKRASGGESSRR